MFIAFKLLSVLGFVPIFYAAYIIAQVQKISLTEPVWFPRKKIRMLFKVGVILIAVGCAGVFAGDILNSITVLPGKMGVTFQWNRL